MVNVCDGLMICAGVSYGVMGRCRACGAFGLLDNIGRCGDCLGLRQCVNCGKWRKLNADSLCESCVADGWGVCSGCDDITQDSLCWQCRLRPLRFACVYSADIDASGDLGAWAPSDWERTEDSDQFDYDYLGGDWVGGDHGKWCHILDYDGLVAHCSEFMMVAEDIETMGILGFPGVGVSAAVSFVMSDSDQWYHPGVILSMYVSPMFDQPPSESDWRAVRAAMLVAFS